MTALDTPVLSRADARRNRARILDAALTSLDEDGAGFTLDDVARRAGIAPATLYRHFSSRRALLETLFEDHVARSLQPRVVAALDDPDPWRGLSSALEATAATVVAHRTLLRAGHDVGLITAAMSARFTGSLGVVLGRAQDAGTVRADVGPTDLPVLIAMVAVAAHGHDTDWRRYLGLLLDGLRTPAAAGSPEPPVTTEEPA